ncbi:MAG TPA: multidrug effflux MFS transporter [Spirochaetia bacterium]|nr:multidrug effflux MFS transporter [Spirochaetia bacterium]
MTRQQRNRIILILGALSALGPFTIDMYLPGFSAIAADLHTSLSTVGYSLTSYFIGISVGQLVYGPVTDRYGRKGPLIIGLTIYSAAAVACALSPTVQWLIGARLVAALGACVGIVASRAVVRDLFPVREIAGIFSTYMLIIAVSPMLAPTVGGYVTANLGWRVIFYILTGIAVAIAIVVIAWLPESKAPDHGVSLRPASIIKRYIRVAANRQFLTFSIAAGMSFGGLLAYVSGAPFLLMHLFGLSQTQFGWGFAVNALGLIAGSQVNRVLLRRYTARRIAVTAVVAQLLFGSLLVAGALFHVTPLAGVFSVLFCFLFATGLVNPNTAALAIEPFETHAGSASALLGCLQMGFAAVASGLVSLLANGTAIPMMVVIWGCSVASYVVLRTIGRRQLAPVPEASLE